MFQNEHFEGTNKVLEEFKEKGYKVIPIFKKPVPDIIAIKDGKIYAIEVEFERKGKTIKSKKYNKYKGINYFDDVIWILKESKIGD